METKELCNKIKYLIKKQKSFIEICNELQLKDYEVIGLIGLMKQDGELIDYVNGELVRLKTPPKINDVYQVEASSSHIPLLLISDTHLCSKYDRLDILRYLYAKADERGVKHILHSGDFTDGRSNRPEHIYELREPSYEGQVDYCVEKYPTFDGKTYVISGNHDDWWYKSTGSEIVKAIANRRDDIVYLGSDVADMQIGKLKVRLFHGKGGNAYAKCFDCETEILTENGWKYFCDLTKNEKVATLNLKKNEFEWQQPIDYINQQYNGEMYHFKSRTIDMMVTPNHRMLVKRYDKNILQYRKKDLIMPSKSHQKINLDWQIIEAKDLENAKRQEWQFKRGGQSWTGDLIESVDIPIRSPKKYASNPIKHIGSVKIEDIAELIAWYTTEGYSDGKKISISQSEVANSNNHKKIIDLFKRIGFKKIKTSGRDNKDISVYSVELSEYLIRECGSGSYNKFLPKWLKNQPSNILKIVFDTMIEGDGWKIGKSSFGYKSVSKRLLDDVSEIAHKLGYGVSKNKDTITMSAIQNYPTINNKPEKINYSGNIYCVSVPNTIILVRRNGKTCWSGNSYKVQKYLDSIPLEERPHILQTGHIHQSFYMKQDDTHCFQTSCLEDLTPFARSMGFANDKSVWWVDVEMNDRGQIQNITQELETFNTKKLVRRK